MRTELLALRFAKPGPVSQESPVHVRLAVDNHLLIADFEVTARVIYAKPQLSKNEYPYEFDVVELFVTNSDAPRAAYYEFEVSPYNQALQVNVIEPRQEYYFGVKNGFEHSAEILSDGWRAQMRIPLSTLGCKENEPLHLIGNAYAALGRPDKRLYWSLFELPEGKPDFHVPAAFRPLFKGA